MQHLSGTVSSFDKVVCWLAQLNGDLYLLASDQGYLNQPIVWEKLSSVRPHILLPLVSPLCTGFR